MFKLELGIDENIKGMMYLTNINDVLYRIVFMIPKKLFSDYAVEADEVFKSTSFLKETWRSK